MSELERELGSVLNRHSAENGSDTPDFILARFLVGCLDAFNEATKARSAWYGVECDVTKRGGSMSKPANVEIVKMAVASAREFNQDVVHISVEVLAGLVKDYEDAIGMQEPS